MTDKTEAPERADLRIANALRDVVNEALSRYDVPSDVYEQDVLIDAACVCAADKIIRDREDVAQAMVAAALERATGRCEYMASRAYSHHAAEHANQMAEEVRALTPDDARAALARLIAEAVDAELEACALIAYDADDCIMARNAIRARKSPPAD